MKVLITIFLISVFMCAGFADANDSNDSGTTPAPVYYEESNFFMYLIYGIIIFVAIVVMGLLIRMFYKPPKTKSLLEQYKDERDEEEEKEYKEPPKKTKEEKEYEISKEDFRKMWGGG